MTSIAAVAALAGVSTATVSRVLNRTKAVNDETRERVEAAVAKLGYRANPFARSLISGESRLILVIVPDMTLCRSSDPTPWSSASTTSPPVRNS